MECELMSVENVRNEGVFEFFHKRVLKKIKSPGDTGQDGSQFLKQGMF